MSEKDVEQIMNKMEERTKARVQKWREYRNKKNNILVAGILSMLIILCGIIILFVASQETNLFIRAIGVAILAYPEAVVTVALLVFLGIIVLMIWLGVKFFLMGAFGYFKALKAEEELDKKQKGDSHT